MEASREQLSAILDVLLETRLDIPGRFVRAMMTPVYRNRTGPNGPADDRPDKGGMRREDQKGDFAA